jgi:NADPH:quinone reductase-like Zn-dependent oxidoreductase
MRSVRTAGPGVIEVAEVERPVPGPRDVLVRVRACGICGTDAAFVQMGGMPASAAGEVRPVPLGHEPAGEVAEAGAEVAGLKPGDRVVVSPQAAPSGIIGCGGAQGGMSGYLLIEDVATPPRSSRSPGTSPGTSSASPGWSATASRSAAWSGRSSSRSPLAPPGRSW